MNANGEFPRTYGNDVSTRCPLSTTHAHPPFGDDFPSHPLCTNGSRVAITFGISLGLWLAVANEGVSAPPSLTHLFPAGGQRGSKVVVTCLGGSGPWPTKVWSPGIEAVPTSDSGQNQLEVTIPSDLAADRVWVRLYNAEGASTAQPFLIGGLKELNEIEPNDRPREAQVISDQDMTVNGTLLKNNDVDCFAVPLAAGQTLVAAVDANTRIGSPMDAILQVVSPDGIVLAENHDDLKLDPRLAFTATKAGTYVVRLFAFPAAPDTSITFNGGVDHIYRLTLTTGPYVTHSVPLSASILNPGSVAVAGWNIPSETKLNVVLFGDARLVDQQEFEVLDELRRSPEARIGFAFDDNFSRVTRVRLTPQAVMRRLPSTGSKTPMRISVSSSVTGCLDSRQMDDYNISLLKGQQVVISVESRSLDLPLDPVIKLFEPSGSLVAEVDDTGPSRDSLLVQTATQDGDYRLTVGDRLRLGGERCWYLLTVRLEQPDFELSATAEAIVVTSDKPAELTVKVQRRGTPTDAVGPITIQAIGLPAGVTSPAVNSETTGSTSTEVKLTLSSTGVAFSGPVRIVGKSSQPKEIERLARTPARLGVAFESFWLTVVEKQ